MARRDPETDPRPFLGTELARARKAAGFSSQDALAAKLGFDRTLIGTPAITHDQLTRLAALSERPHVSIEIVPASTAANAGLSGGFQLASCDGPPDVLNMSGVEDVTAESRSLLRRATVVFDLVRGDALPRTASRAVITEAAEQWKTR